MAENLTEKGAVAITQAMRDNVQILSIHGHLVYQNVQSAKTSVNELFVEASGYVLDFTETEKIDSTGFGLIFNIVKRKPQDSPIAAVVKDPFIRELFNITKIDRILTIGTDLQEAMAMLAKADGAS